MHTKYEPFLLCGILSLVFFSTEETLFFLSKLIPLLEIKRGKGMHKTLKVCLQVDLDQNRIMSNLHL